MNGNTCAQIQLSLCLHASGFFARNNDQKNWQWRLHAGKTPALMNQAEKIIVTYFHRTEEHAEACLATTPHDAEIANDDNLKSVQADARWAVRMIITREVLLQAFRETSETAMLDAEDLIS